MLAKHSAMLLTFIKLPFSIETSVLSILRDRLRQVLLFILDIVGRTPQHKLMIIISVKTYFESLKRILAYHFRRNVFKLCV